MFSVNKPPRYSRDFKQKAVAEARRDAKSAKKEKLLGVSMVNVPDDCPVFANCDDVRRMIQYYLLGSEMSLYAFAKAIGASDQSVSKFLLLSGECSGSKSVTFRKAWRFFEQFRIYEGKEKTALRLSDEEKWGPSGYSIPESGGGIKTFPPKRQKVNIDNDTLPIKTIIPGEPEADDTII